MASVKKDSKTGLWYIRVSYKDAAGKYRTKTKKGFKTKLEAQTHAGLLEKKKQDQPDLSNERDLTIFADYFENWVEIYIQGKYSVGTDKKYQHEIALVKEYFKDTKLKDLTRQQYQSYLNFRGTNRSKNTVQKTHGYLKKCISYALADGIIKYDPTFGAKLVWDIPEQTRNKYLNKTEADILMDYLVKSEDYKDFMLYISLCTGLRIGEVYGLSYLDVKPTSLSVNRGYDYLHTNDFTPGKTLSAIRTIATNKTIFEKMQKHRLIFQKNNKTYPFLSKNNLPLISHRGLSNHLTVLVKKLGLQQITIHCLRHTHASILFFNEFNIGFISKRLGHANISETLNTYTHIIKELEQTQNEKIVDLFSAKKVQN